MHSPCLYDLCFGLPNNGVGRKLRRKLWLDPDCYVTLTRVEVHAVPRSTLKRGKAWGLHTWRGVTDTVEKRVNGACKREWKVRLSLVALLRRSRAQRRSLRSLSTCRPSRC